MKDEQRKKNRDLWLGNPRPYYRLEDRRSAQRLDKGQCHSNLQKEQEGGSRELQVSQSHLHSGKGDGAAHPGGHHQASGGKEAYQE